jgi:hypothetical protein
MYTITCYMRQTCITIVTFSGLLIYKVDLCYLICVVKGSFDYLKKYFTQYLLEKGNFSQNIFILRRQ